MSKPIVVHCHASTADRFRAALPDAEIVTDTVSPSVYYLMTGKLSLAAAAELAKRVKAGEDETRVKLELLLKEGKVVGG